MMKELTYTKQGEYYLPNLTLGETREQPLGKYGMMRRSFLQENKPILYNDLILKGKLFDHLREIEERASRRMEQTMKELKSQIAGLAAASAAKIISGNADEKESRDLYDQFLKEAGEGNGNADK